MPIVDISVTAVTHVHAGDRHQPPHCLDDQHTCDVDFEDPRDLQRVARRLERDLIRRCKALSEQLQRVRLGLDLTRRARLSVLVNRDLAEVAVHVHPDPAQAILLTVDS